MSKDVPPKPLPGWIRPAGAAVALLCLASLAAIVYVARRPAAPALSAAQLQAGGLVVGRQDTQKEMVAVLSPTCRYCQAFLREEFKPATELFRVRVYVLADEATAARLVCAHDGGALEEALLALGQGGPDAIPTCVATPDVQARARAWVEQGRALGVQAVPTFAWIDGGELVDQQTGYTPKEPLPNP